MGVTWYVDKVGGSATNSGSSEGNPKASGSQAAYNSGSGIIDLSLDLPDLSSVVASGDTIYLQSATGGVWDAATIFKIIAVDDILKTVTVGTAKPTNSNTGKNWAIGGAFSTMQRAIDAHYAGLNEDTYVKNSAVYTEAVISDHLLGVDETYSKFEGYSVTPGDNGIVEIDGKSTRSIGISFVTKDIVVKNFKVHHHVSHGISLGDRARVVNCESYNNGGNGINSTDGAICFRCYCYNNTADGILVAQGNAVILCCTLIDNNYGLECAGGVVWKTLCRGNAVKNLRIMGETGQLGLVLDSLVDGDNKDSDVGIEIATYFATNDGAAVINTLVYDCVSGIEGYALIGFPPNVFSYNNLVNGNTTPYTNFGTTGGEITTAPTFINEGTDYTPASGSPAIEKGMDQVGAAFLALTGKRVSIGGIEPVENPIADYPLISDVRSGITFDSGSQSGTLILPSPDNVRLGVDYGAP